MKPIRIAILLMLTSGVAATAACRTHGDRTGETGSANRGRVDLSVALCDGKSPCEDFDFRSPEMFLHAHVSLTDCFPDQTALLFGAWSVEDAGARPFEWQAEVRLGGVFPSIGHVSTNLGCTDEYTQMHSPDIGLAIDPDGFAWAKLAGEDVFIPFRGTATVDHDFHATAVVDAAGAAAAPRVTVSVDGPDAPPTRQAGLGPGDSFAWGSYRAVVVRVVAPQDGLLGAIGWVEIALADWVSRGR
jgi:hypothetical protein